MRKIFLGLLLLAGFQSLAQRSELKGRIIDTLENRELHHAVVALLRKSDSTLYQYARTDKNGRFVLPNLDTGLYLMLVTYPKFADFADEIRIEGAGKDLGIVPLIQKSALLETVIVKQHWSIRMKGDTVEYKADSFKVAEGASVKDLLRKLPGLQVDKNGQVTAQGQKVEKVLVDGEEFFSDDPAVVIENLRADAVDKVQSFDKKSDQAEFTGVDDGSRSKTLNLVLKDDKKKGLLGKIVTGAGTEERYSGEAMLNYFKSKKKASVYGIASNTGKTGLGWEDRGKFGGGSDFDDAEVEMGAGFIMINSDGDNDFSDWGSTYDGEGVPRIIKAGAHYSDKWNEEKQKANGNYSLKDHQNYAEGNSIYKYTLPDSSYYIREDHRANTRTQQHLANALYDVKFDSLSSLRIKLNGKVELSETRTGTHSVTEDELLNPLNVNNRLHTSDGENRTFLASALWRQKFKKKGRTLSLSASQKYHEADNKGFLYSLTEFYDGNGNLFNTDSIDQYKTSNSDRHTTTSKLVYTEPAGKKGMIEFNYAFQRAASTLNRKSFDKQAGKYSDLNELFSVRYGLVHLSNSGGIKYQYNGKKLTANIGTNIGRADYRQKDSLGRELLHFSYTNLFPTSRITYRFTSQRSLNFTYSGSPQPPSIEQIQPTRENTNPLFITRGNPELDQAFRHTMSVFFTDFKMLTGRTIWFNASYTTTQNAIVTSQVINSGITNQQYINAGGNNSFWLYGTYGFKLKKPEIHLGLNLSGNGTDYVNFINGKRNTSRNRTAGIGMFASKYKEEKYYFNFNADLNYNRSLSTISGQKTHFTTQSYSGNAQYSITKKFQVGTSFDIDLREKTDVFTGNNNISIWNLDVSYKIFKKNNGIIKLELQDLLKQRRGFNREFNGNYLFEKNYNALGQYALLSFTWNFTKTPGVTN